MQRLPFVLPDFTRLMWVSDGAREVWAPRLARITRAWLEIEWRAIVAGVRRCAITSVSPDGLVSDAARWLDHGLAALRLEVQRAGRFVRQHRRHARSGPAVRVPHSHRTTGRSPGVSRGMEIERRRDA